MAKGESKKRQMITEIFEALRTLDSTSDVLVFNNETAKSLSTKHRFRNMFDAVKFDTNEKLPDALKQAGFFIVHTGHGNHAFVKGIGYHSFEPIQQEKQWQCTESVVSKLGNSEADTVSTIYNERIIHDFLFGNKDADLKIHISRRSTTSFGFSIGKNALHVDRLQIEMDALFESNDTIVTVEVKNIKHSNFEIRQPYSAFRYLDKFVKAGKIPASYKIRHLFVVANKGKREEFYRVYEYSFSDWEHMDSIVLVKNAQYNLSTANQTL